MSIESEAGVLEQGYSRQTERKKKKSGVGMLLLAVTIWLVLLGGTFYTAKNYFEQAVRKIQQVNSINVEALNQRMEGLALELREIKVLLNVADESITTSGSLQKDLNDRITLLDQQLKNLEESLMILKEAP